MFSQKLNIVSILLSVSFIIRLEIVRVSKIRATAVSFRENLGANLCTCMCHKNYIFYYNFTYLRQQFYFLNKKLYKKIITS